MNIFILDYDMQKSVEYYIDAHIRKMLLEYTQILSTVCRLNGLDVGYKATHVNHPCVKWCGKSVNNWFWLWHSALFLHDEYNYRFNKEHKSYNILYEILEKIKFEIFSNTDITPHPLIMPDKYKTNDIVESYRNYYKNEKRTDKNGKNIAIWTNRDVPYWFYE